MLSAVVNAAEKTFGLFAERRKAHSEKWFDASDKIAQNPINQCDLQI